MSKRPDYRREPKVPEPTRVEKNVLVDPARIDRHSLQSREKTDKVTVEEYREAMTDGAEFPPTDLFTWDDGDRFFIGDGFHRVEALSEGQVLANVAVYATEDDARLAAAWKAITSNITHGLRRSQKDRRRAVTLAIEYQPRLNDSRIAALVGVDSKTVARVRAEMEGRPDPYKKDEPEEAEKPPRKEREDREDPPELKALKEEALSNLQPVPDRRRRELNPAVVEAKLFLMGLGSREMRDQPELVGLVQFVEAWIQQYEEGE